MLILLLKTRLTYYKNYLRHHFDRKTTLELLVIVAILALLLVRSPADIGYNFTWLSDEQFPAQWAIFFGRYFMIAYFVLAQLFALFTLRVTREWQLLGALPLGRRTIADYFLFRHVGKTGLLLLVGALPFLLASANLGHVRIVQFVAALGVLLLLQLASFYQAFRFRHAYFSNVPNMLVWLPVEFAMLALLIGTGPKVGACLSAESAGAAACLLPVLLAFSALLVHCRKTFVLKQKQARPRRRSQPLRKGRSARTRSISGGAVQASVMRDMLLMWRRKSGSAIIPLITTAVSLAVVVAEDNSSAVYVSLIFLEAIFSFLMIGTMLKFFEWDAEVAHLLRSLPLTAATLWFARWLLVFGIIATPAVLSLIAALLKFGLTGEFILFAFAGAVFLPAIMATIFCNGGFGLFPHFNLSGYIISISIIMIFLFWFFMPFGSLILLAVMVFWIRKSQRHFQNLEIP
ncbi:MAG: hypothetical protein ACOY90_20280 [Candidatus Zhuqueibacterota bacterium]